jgi:hypothetical protein
MVPGQQLWRLLSTLPAWQLTQVPRATADDWEQQLTDALGAFRALRWPRTYLRPAPPATRKPAPA